MISRRILAAVVLLWAVPCLAQTGGVKTPSQLNTEINTNFADNNSGAISPFVMRQYQLDQVASVPFLNFANAFLQPQTFNLGITVAGSFVAPGLVTNADLASPSTSVNGVTCTLGSTCTVTATATSVLTFGTHLTGTSYNGSSPVTIATDATDSNTVSTIVARDGSGGFSAGTITAALTGHASLDLALSGLGTGVQTALGIAANSPGGFITSAGSGTVTSVTAGQGCVSGTTGQAAITSSGTINCPTGSSNKLRNSSLSSWFHGSGVAITTSGGWGAEGIFIVPTGASVTSNRVTANSTLPDSFAQQQIVGNTSVTDVTVRFVIESLDAAPLVGQQVTFQVPVLNNTGGSITPKITVKYPTAQDNYASTTTDSNANGASMQVVTSGATGVLSFSWPAMSAAISGMSIDIDFGNNFSSNAKSIIIGGGFDCHVTPGVSTGTVSAPPTPEVRSVAEDLVWNQRFYATNYPNGTAPGTATHSGMVYAGFVISGFVSAAAIQFPTQMNRAPSVSYWDGAGNASKVSHAASASSTITFTDNIAASVAPTDISATGFLVSGDGVNANTTSFINYAADATLAGG